MRVRFLFALPLLILGGMAVAADDPKPVEVGKSAPAIKLPAANIQTVLPDKKDAKELSLEDLKGKNVVLFFFPKAMTRG
jgi:peroxiredoxin